MAGIYKIYKSTTGVEYNFYVKVDGKEHFVSFDNPGATLTVRDMKLAKAIEDHKAFKAGKIHLASMEGVMEETEEVAETEKTRYPDVKNMGDAVEVLMSEYGIEETELALKKDVLAKAKELGVVFPNYR